MTSSFFPLPLPLLSFFPFAGGGTGSTGGLDDEANAEDEKMLPADFLRSKGETLREEEDEGWSASDEGESSEESVGGGGGWGDEDEEDEEKAEKRPIPGEKRGGRCGGKHEQKRGDGLGEAREERPRGRWDDRVGKCLRGQERQILAALRGTDSEDSTAEIGYIELRG